MSNKKTQQDSPHMRDGYFDMPQDVLDNNILYASWVSQMSGFVSRLLSSIGEYGQFRLVANPQYNAFIQRSSEHSGINIGVHDPVPWVNRYVPMQLLSSRELFSHIGDPLSEESSVPKWGTQSWTREGISNLRMTAPKCPKRFEFARLISNAIDMFIVFHEAAHLQSKHLDIMRLEGLGATFLESNVYKPEEDRITAQLRQGMEFEADATAVISMLNAMPDRSDMHREAVLVGAMIFMCLISNAQREFDLSSTHPRSIYRLFYVKHLAEIAKVNPIPKKEADRILDEMIWIVFSTGLQAGAVTDMWATRRNDELGDMQKCIALLDETRVRLALQ